MKSVGWTLFLLTVAGIIFYGWARTVLLVLLIGGGLFVVLVSIWGITMAEKQERRKKLEAERLVEGAARHNVERLVAQATALATIGTERGQTAADEELKRLRRMAGLDTAD